MSSPQPALDVEPSEKVLSLRQKRQKQYQRSLRTARYRALGWELTGRLSVNLALSLVAIAALVKLIPYHQTQRQVLQELEASVSTLKAHNHRLRSDFARYFDPAQTSQVLQENGARESSQHVPIIWVEERPQQPGASASPPADLDNTETAPTDTASEDPAAE